MRIIEHRKTLKLPDGTEQEIVENEYVYSLRCNFCGIETGTLSFLGIERPDVESYPEKYGIADSRCENCTQTKGTYAAELASTATAEIEADLVKEPDIESEDYASD